MWAQNSTNYQSNMDTNFNTCREKISEGCNACECVFSCCQGHM